MLGTSLTVNTTVKFCSKVVKIRSTIVRIRLRQFEYDCQCIRTVNKYVPQLSMKMQYSTCVFGLCLYNSLPKYLRDQIIYIAKLKFELDKFLALIYHEPKMYNYVTAARNNSILDQLSHGRAQTKNV